ncbi:MauE/DoxX family redox-associated membrane protein [Chamaesiphon sp.]|uniref:MauE/DoxX family redox-associated membrane protein n=1 Tax=Chamaesiphon sp. TaxID=2814140 RepID=UPI00359446D0
MSNSESECPWGLKAVKLLQERGLNFEDIKLRSREEVDELKAKYQVSTTPQIFCGRERIGGYTDLASRLSAGLEPTKISYTPVIALFSTAGLMTLALSLKMSGFMGIALSMLASLKLMDLDSFTASFQNYDLVTKKFKSYGKIYPFLELAIGLGFLSGVAPLLTGIASTTVGVSGVGSVVKAVYIDKMALNCACVGGNSKAPLGVISMAENLMMTIMGAMLIYTSTNIPTQTSTRTNSISPLPIVDSSVAESKQNLSIKEVKF